MRKIELNLTDYDFEGKDEKLETKTFTVNMKEELSALLRINGIYDGGVEMVDGVDVARQIKNCKEDVLELSETEHALIKKVLDKLIKNEQIKFGGIRYEELVLRVFKAKENGNS